MSIRLPFILEALTAAVFGAGLASVGVLAIKKYFIDAHLAPNYTFIAFVTWDEVITIIPWLFLIGVLTTVLSSSVALRRYLRG